MPATVTVRPDGSGDYTTIAAGINAVDVYGTVLIGSGTYTEYINLTQQIGGGWAKPVRLVAENTSSKPIINGAAQTASAVISNANTQVANTSSLYVEGLIFVSCSHSNGVFQMGGNRALEVRNCEFYTCNTTLIRFMYSDATYIGIFERNYCYNVGQIYSNNIGAYSRVYNNYGYFNSDVTALNVSSNTAVVVNNTFIFNNGASFKGIVAGRITNNIVVNRGSGWRSIEATATASYNCVSGTWSLAVSGALTTGNITADPLFENSTLSAGSGALSSTSPCIKVGDDLSALFTTDILGNSRTAPFDIGAYERAASSPWTGFSTQSYEKISIGTNIIINTYKNLTSNFSVRSGLSELNGMQVVEQVPFSLGIPGAFSLRGRNKTYSLTLNPDNLNQPSSSGY